MKRGRIAAAVAAVIMAAGCASQEPAVSGRKEPAITTPMPISVRNPAPMTTTTTTGQSPPCDPLASYRPTALPAPGKMPADSTMAAIQKRGRLIVAVGAVGNLLAFPNIKDGRMEGFEAEIAREIAFTIFGVPDDSKIQWRTVNARDRKRIVGSGEVDMVLAAMTMTCARWNNVYFSVDYYTAGQGILINRDREKEIKSKDDLGDKKVCASQDSTNIPVLQHLPVKPIVVSALNTGDCLLMLQQRQIDAVSTGDVILAGLAAQDPGTTIVGDRFTTEPTGIAIAKENEDLVRFVNAVLEKLKSDGTWTRLQRQWLATKIGTADPPVPNYGRG